MTPSAQPQTHARGCLIQAVISFVVACVMIPTVLGLAFLANNVRYDSPWTTALMIGAPLVLVGGVLLLGLGFGVWNRRRIARWLDAAMLSLGLNGRPYTLIGRQYHGEVQGRAVHARFRKGPAFELAVECDARTRMTASAGNALNRRADTAISHPALDAGDIVFRAGDPAHARALLERPGVVDALVRLSGRQGIAWARNVIVLPHAIKLNLHRVGMGAITAESVQSWHHDLLLIARALDAMADPGDVLTPTAHEVDVLRHPDRILRMGYRIVAVIMVLLLGLALCGGLLGVWLSSAST
ncbi:MAG: hypothetical protein GXP62_01310 [Oligoflexia bacterium]|nr:hypothetical protein [Oligoflexia bacterium]